MKGEITNLLIGIIIGILIWQLITTVLLLIDDFNTTFDLIICGIPLLLIWIIGYPFRKTDFFNRIKYYRCRRMVKEEGKADTREYYCTVHDERYGRITLPGDEKTYRMTREWFVSNTRYVTRKEIRKEGLIYWKKYQPLEEI